MVSGLLTTNDKEKIKRTIPKASNKIIDAAVARLYVAYPNFDEWKYTGISGAVVICNDLVGNTFFLKIVDINGNNGVIWDQELYVDFRYNQDRSFFHTFELDDCYAGLSFADENEATHFLKRVTHRDKHASKATLANKNAIALKKSSKPTPPSVAPGPRGAPSQVYSVSSINREDDIDPAWKRLFAQLEEMGITEDMIAENVDFIKDYINQQGGELVGKEVPIPRKASRSNTIKSMSSVTSFDDHSSSSRRNRAPPPPPPPPPVSAPPNSSRVPTPSTPSSPTDSSDSASQSSSSHKHHLHHFGFAKSIADSFLGKKSAPPPPPSRKGNSNSTTNNSSTSLDSNELNEQNEQNEKNEKDSLPSLSTTSPSISSPINSELPSSPSNTSKPMHERQSKFSVPPPFVPSKVTPPQSNSLPPSVPASAIQGNMQPVQNNLPPAPSAAAIMNNTVHAVPPPLMGRQAPPLPNRVPLPPSQPSLPNRTSPSISSPSYQANAASMAPPLPNTSRPVPGIPVAGSRVPPPLPDRVPLPQTNPTYNPPTTMPSATSSYPQPPASFVQGSAPLAPPPPPPPSAASSKSFTPSVPLPSNGFSSSSSAPPPPPPPPPPSLPSSSSGFSSAPPPPPPPPSGGFSSSAPPPPPPPPSQSGGFTSTAPPPPPPPPSSRTQTSMTPAVSAPSLPSSGDAGRDALLASIRSAGGVGVLKKVDKSALDKPSVILQQQRGEPISSSNSAANNNTSAGAGAQASLADVLAVALNKRKNKVAQSDDEDSGDEWD